MNQLNKSGMSITEVMVAAGLTMIVAYGIAELFRFSGLQERNLRGALTRDRLVADLIRQVNYAPSLKKSAEKVDLKTKKYANEAFHWCVFAPTPSPLPSSSPVPNPAPSSSPSPCVINPNQGFTLYTPQEAPVAGPSDTPARYSVDGGPCTTGSAPSDQCPFEAITSFTPDCGMPNPSPSAVPSPLPSCAPGQAITISYSVGVSQSNTVTLGNLKSLKTMTGQITLATTDIRQSIDPGPSPSGSPSPTPSASPAIPPEGGWIAVNPNDPVSPLTQVGRLGLVPTRSPAGNYYRTSTKYETRDAFYIQDGSSGCPPAAGQAWYNYVNYNCGGTKASTTSYLIYEVFGIYTGTVSVSSAVLFQDYVPIDSKSGALSPLIQVGIMGLVPVASPNGKQYKLVNSTETNTAPVFSAVSGINMWNVGGIEVQSVYARKF